MWPIRSDFLLERFSKREKNLLLILALVVAAVILFQYFYSFYWQQYKVYQEEITTKSNEIMILEEKIREQEELEKEITHKKLLLDEKKERFQYNIASGAPWVQIDNLAAQNNLRLLSAKPQKIAEEEIYSKLPLTVSLEGNKSNIAAFVRSLENLQNLWVVENIIMERDFSNNSQVTSGTVEMNLYGSVNDEDLMISEDQWPAELADIDLEKLITEEPIAEDESRYEDDTEAPQVETQFIYREDYSFPLKTGGN